MLREERQDKIYSLLQNEGYVEINYLSKKFNVTEMTIRRDLDQMSKQFEIIRTHGGARIEGQRTDEPPYESRVVRNSDLKLDIAKMASSLIDKGQTVYIDSGTTTMFLAEEICEENENTIVTNGINIASIILENESANLLLIGGDLRKNTHSTRGALAEEQVRKFKFDIAFLGTNAVGDDGKLYVGNTAETGMKNCVIKGALKKYVLVDSSKFNTYNLVSYAHASEVTAIITDRNTPQNVIENLEEQGVKIILAD